MSAAHRFCIRPETPADLCAIRALVTSAFADAPHSSGTEAEIVDGLRRYGALSVSLVAEPVVVPAAATAESTYLGHIAFSRIDIERQGAGASASAPASELSDNPAGWYGLGPLAVAHAVRGHGIGAALVAAGLDHLRRDGAQGCVVLGDPAYYGRFGFRSDPALRLPGFPAQYFQCLSLADAALPAGIVRYHPAFGSGP